MFKTLIFILTAVLIATFSSRNAHAIEDPLTIANNKFGVHILFTSELDKAKELVNSNGGDWGYVTIPIQATDRDLEKWQKFLDLAKQKHIIPIIRIATENYYFDTSVWRKPQYDDILDFANFLNSLEWPVKNRYIIIFNEVNRGDEWGGSPNPAEYAQILSYAAKVFKSLSHDFFIISAGLDNASANDQYDFMIQMNREVPGIFGQIDGLGSHSYPNPGFSTPPWIITKKSISSFKFEENLAFQLSGKNLPVFITETGWSRERIPESQIASYFRYAFEKVWNDQNIVAVTPFLLMAGTEPFSHFSLLDEGQYNDIGSSLKEIIKTKGNPTIDQKSSSYLSKNIQNFPLKIFSNNTRYETALIQGAKAITPFLKWILKIYD